MIEITVGGREFKGAKMDARTQFHVARRITPVFPDIIGSLHMLRMMVEGQKIEIGKFQGLINGGVDGLSRMSDADADYVLDHCLSLVSMKQGDAWVKIWSQQSGPMFDFLTLPDMMTIVWAVIRGNVGNFFPAPQPTSK